MEAAAQFTPGPWADVSQARGRDKSSLVATSDGPLAIDCTQSGKTLAQDRANARLIAAAPDLYEALAQVVAEYDVSDHDDMHRVASDMVRIARAALASATPKAVRA
jgi:hypothetical protein